MNYSEDLFTITCIQKVQKMSNKKALTIEESKNNVIFQGV